MLQCLGGKKGELLESVIAAGERPQHALSAYPRTRRRLSAHLTIGKKKEKGIFPLAKIYKKHICAGWEEKTSLPGLHSKHERREGGGNSSHQKTSSTTGRRVGSR